MAEQLGQAVLELTVDTKALEKGLDDARKKIAKLTGDVSLGIKTQGADAPQQALKNISTQAERATTRVQSLNQVLNQIPGNTYSKLSASISKLTSESRDLQLTSEQYLKTLTRIRELEGIRQLKVGRQQALAGEAAYGPDGALGQLNQAQLPQLPLTLEGQAQNIRELQQRLRNLNFESAEYAETLRVLQNAQRQYDQTLSGTSDTYRQLSQQEEAAIRRAEKLRGIQEYYADKNPRAGGIRDDNGNMLARGANSAADERAYNAALRPSQTLLENDLQRVQALRQVTQRLQEQLALIDQIRGNQGNDGFGAASAANFGTTDPVQKSIRRNQEKRAKQEAREDGVRQQLERGLNNAREERVKAETAYANAVNSGVAAERARFKRLNDAAQRRGGNGGEVLGNALIGGAFPLLFGQGIGASLGGGLGGAAGGQLGGQFGFGLSLIGTAVGQQFDVAIQKVQLLGEALDDPIAKFSELADAGLISSKSQEKLIQNLISVGREAEAQALLQQDLAASFGDLSSAKELAEATDELYRAFAQLSTLLAQLAGPILTGVINSFTGLIRKYAQILLLSPDRVQARERQATDVVESQSTPLQRTGFFGPVNVKFNGKTYTGSAAGVREQIIRELLQQEFDNFTSGSQGGSNVNSKELQQILDLRKQIKDLTVEQIQADSDGNRTQSLRLQRLQVELNLQKELGKYNDKNDPGGKLREEARARAAEKLAKIDAELRKRPVAGSLGVTKEELGFLDELRNRLPVASEGFRAVDAAIVRTKDALGQLEGAAAKVRFDNIQQALDTGDIGRSLVTLREQLSAAQQVVDNFNWDELYLDPAAADQAISDLTRVQDSVRELEKRKAEVTVRVIGAQIANGEIARSFNNLRDQLNAAQTVVDNFDFNSLSEGAELALKAQNEIRKLQGLPPLPFKVGREGLTSAIADLVRIQDQINKLDNTKATVEVEVLQVGINTGAITNSIANQQRLQQAAQRAFETAPIGSKEAQQAAAAYLKAGQVLKEAGEIISATPQELQKSANALAKQFSDLVQNLKDLRLDNQRFLSPQARQQSLAQLERDVAQTAARRNERITFVGSPESNEAAKRQYIAFDRAERGLQGQISDTANEYKKVIEQLEKVKQAYKESTDKLAGSNDTLTKAVAALSEKNWTVNVNVPGGSASGDVVSAVNSRS